MAENTKAWNFHVNVPGSNPHEMLALLAEIIVFFSRMLIELQFQSYYSSNYYIQF